MLSRSDQLGFIVSGGVVSLLARFSARMLLKPSLRERMVCGQSIGLEQFILASGRHRALVKMVVRPAEMRCSRASCKSAGRGHCSFRCDSDPLGIAWFTSSLWIVLVSLRFCGLIFTLGPLYGPSPHVLEEQRIPSYQYPKTAVDAERDHSSLFSSSAADVPARPEEPRVAVGGRW